MSVAEYTATLLSILIGLALADLAASLQRLLRAGPRVRWDVLAPAAALLTTAFVINVWWVSYAGLARLERLSVMSFLPDLVSLVLLFSLASSALPDAVDETGLDLRAWYDANRRSFWRLFAVYIGWVTAVIAARAIGGGATAGQLAGATLPNLVLLGLMLWLAGTGRRAVHIGVVALLLVVTGLSWLPQEVAERELSPA